MDRQQYDDALRVARQLWREKYPSEPFDLPLDVARVGAEVKRPELQYDLAEAVKRQQMFYYQVGGKLKRWQ